MSAYEIKTVTKDNIADAVAVFNRFAAQIPYWFPMDESSFGRDIFEGARTLHDVPFPFEPLTCLIGYVDGEPQGWVHAGIAPRLGVESYEEITRGSNAVIRCLLFPEQHRQLGEDMLDSAMEFFLSRNPDRMIAFEGELGYPNMSGGAGLCPARLGHIIEALKARRFKESFRFVWYGRTIGDEEIVELDEGINIKRERESRNSGDLLKYSLCLKGQCVSECYVALMLDLAGRAGAGQAYIQLNITQPGHRRKGWAKLLTRHILADLKAYAMKRLFTLVPVDNLSARRLYERVGFSPGEECLEMER